MTRYIDADAVMRQLMIAIDVGESLGTSTSGLEAVYDNLKLMNTIEIKKGTWTEEYDPNADLFFRRRWRCSACNGWNTYGTPNYCPDCGAEMTNSTERMKEANHGEAD